MQKKKKRKKHQEKLISDYREKLFNWQTDNGNFI